jgi:hypothetical protein
VGRGEMPIEHGDSWFSPKCIEVQPALGAPGGGRALVGRGGFTAYQLRLTCECRQRDASSETVGANVHRQKGNSPDLPLRPPSIRSVVKEVGSLRQPGGWLRSSHP